MALGVATPTLIHQGPGWCYLNVCAPGAGKRHLIGSDGTPTQPAWVATTAVTAGQQVVDSNGNVEEVTTAGTTGSSAPTWGTTLGAVSPTDGSAVWTVVALAPAYEYAGASEAATEVTIGPKYEETGADQETAAIDVVMTAEANSIEVTLKQSDMVRLGLSLPGAAYTTGTDTNLPSGVQVYEQLTYGGLPPAGVQKISVLMVSKRKDVTNKFVVSQLYKAYQADAVKLGVQRGKETTYKVTFKGLADEYRLIQDRVGTTWRQI